MPSPKSALITGATGNIGSAVINYLIPLQEKNRIKIIAGVRSIERAKKRFPEWEKELEFRPFDFEDAKTYEHALEGIDTVFLLRPPHITSIEEVFRPLLERIKEKGIREVVFLSVQGVEKSKVIPHHKIEREIKEKQLPYVFLRPSYFMQNLTTTLFDDIRQKRKIILPAGKAVFNWVDVENIGEVAAQVISRFDEFKNSALELTGYENETFEKVAASIREVTGENIEYKSVHPFRYYFMKKREGIPAGKIMVMILLHFLPRFQSAPAISKEYERITGKQPTRLLEFISREKGKFIA
jgi:uncharacterized protein YbjT (DUF2867 family)